MGYRSDVGYVIRFKDIDTMKRFVAVHAINEHTREALEDCKVCIGPSSPCPPELHFDANCVKWYESFDDVKAHESLLDFLDDNGSEYGAGYKFVRIGEEIDDIEQRYGGDDEYIPWDALFVNRSIAWDVYSRTQGASTIAIVREAPDDPDTNS